MYLECIARIPAFVQNPVIPKQQQLLIALRDFFHLPMKAIAPWYSYRVRSIHREILNNAYNRVLNPNHFDYCPIGVYIDLMLFPSYEVSHTIELVPIL